MLLTMAMELMAMVQAITITITANTINMVGIRPLSPKFLLLHHC